MKSRGTDGRRFMRKILVVSHSKLAQGFVAAMDLICGGGNKVDFINAYVDNTPLSEQLKDYFSKLNPEDEKIVLTDLAFGSPNNECTPYIKTHWIKLVSGINLALLLAVVMEDENAAFSDENIERLIQDAKDGICYINKKLAETAYTEDFDF